MKILLVCNAGMSTSMLVQRMEKAATEKNLEVEIIALPILEAEKILNEWDVVMLGPQVRHCKAKLEEASTGTPIEVIDMRAYGMMNGQAVLERAIEIIENNK